MRTNKVFPLVLVELKKFYRDITSLGVMLLMPVVLTLVFYFALGNVANDYYPPGINTHFEYLMPGAMGYSVIYMGMMVALALAEYRESGLLKRIQVAPVSSAQYLVSHIIANMIVAVVQAYIVLLLAWILGFNPQGGLLGLLVVGIFLALLAITSVGFALITASVAKNSGAASGLSMVFLLPMMIFGTLLTVFNDATLRIAKFTPNFYVSSALMKIFTGVPLSNLEIWQNMLTLAVISLVAIIAGMQIFKKLGYRK